MTQDELSDEQRMVLEAVVENRELELRHVHRELVDDTDTRFARCPDYGEGYNEERRAVRNHLRELQNKGLVDVDGRGKPWYPTTAGKIVANNG